ncbi:hypothetical protein GCM10010329_26570 [Streptomyces spiroverticillatus]|uniref:CDP-alcohol phosphatidyltransferase family protein n=1 Tax=Streptomyces finlayi TaxID=67296 RepID=A0A918WVF3_9ACTN|nr:CDP-alcohol phosphatidyltransferase family protein [Streptomyces finlayi]GHA03065.1 hypothetical protein GCM10010329_26570 [Streptomyces spiroverticillatus]GHC87256.1 hypothetical protein GCM10010334_18980 [Streptomyces finlayi]
MRRLSQKAIQDLTCKKRDAWWTVALVDPVATRLVRTVAFWKWVTPNRVTWASLFVGLGAAYCFSRADWNWLALGALLYHVSFILDCVDGKLARLTGNGTVFGAWLDYVFDRIRVMLCAIALMGGQYWRTGNEIYLLGALAVVFLDMLRYVDSLQIYKMRISMRRKIENLMEERKGADGEGAEVVFIEDLLRENPGLNVACMKEKTGEVVDLHAQFRSRFPWYARVRTALVSRRIRPHLVSGIEFQMAVFIVGPLLGQIVATTAAAGLLLGLFELAIMYKFWLSTRDFTRVVEGLSTEGTSTGIPATAFRGRHRGASSGGRDWVGARLDIANSTNAMERVGA